MSYPQFTTSTKDNSLSMKVKGIKATDTKKLEADSRQMEERLRELKLTMSLQKEERERQGGNYWNAGQPGALTTHADEVLKKNVKSKSNKSNEKKPKKIKILKDEPLDKPERSTSKPLVTSSRSSKSMKGPVCGQCEQKAAALSCMECGEDYCAGCFAQFHLKGALRKHRSVPFQANRGKGAYDSSSPSKSLTTSGGSVRSSHSLEYLPATSKIQRSDDSSANGSAASNAGGSLLRGSYNEEENAAAFAAALSEWRQGRKPASSNKTTPPSLSPSSKPAVTETSSEAEPSRELVTPVDIEFKEHTLSYADRLMLKKHRRTELEPLHTPRLTGSTTPYSRYTTSRCTTSSYTTVIDNHLSDEEAELEEEHERYVRMFKPRNHQPEKIRLESALSIIEVPDSVDNDGLEEATTYSVKEDDDDKEFIVNTAASFTRKENTVSSDAIRNGTSSQTKETKSVDSIPLKPTKPNSSRPSSRVRSGVKTAGQQKKVVKPDEQELRKERGEPSANRGEPVANRAQRNKQSKGVTENGANPRTKSKNERRSKSRTSKTQDSVERPTKSSAASSHRPTSARLTTEPSEGLKLVSQQAKDEKYTYKENLSDFFTAGVKEQTDKNEETVERNVSLSSNQPTYQGGPALWRPASSLSCHLEDINPEFVTGQDFGIADFLKGPSHSNLERAHRQSSTEPPSWPLTTPPPQTWSDEDSEPLLRSRPPLSASQSRPAQRTASARKAKTENPAVSESKNTVKDKDKPQQSTRVSERHSTSASNKSSTEGVMQPRKPNNTKKTRGRRRLERPPRPSSRIEVDGDDMSRYDDDGHGSQDEDDNEALYQLEWELASQDGRVTADGTISRMSVLDDIIDNEDGDGGFGTLMNFGDTDLGIEQDDGQGSGLSSPCDDIDIEKRLSEEELLADFEENERQMMTDEVKALKS